MAEMTKRERMMNACLLKPVDRVPVAPDMSNMIPCKLTGKPFWDIYYYANPPLWKAYLNAAEHYGIDAWFMDGYVDFKYKDCGVTSETKLVLESDKRMARYDIINTPAGQLTSKSECNIGDPPTPTEKVIKNFKEDMPKLKYLFPEIIGYDAEGFKERKKMLGENGMMGAGISPPGLHIFNELFNGNLEACTYAYYDEPDLFMELAEMQRKMCMQQIEIYCELGIDSILTGGSGSITMQSPDIWEELSLPTIKDITRICRQAGVISGIHSCGKEMYLIDRCYKETDLNYVNPLEIAPMGDSTLKEAKDKYGDKLCIMGNLHTTNVMLYGSPELVKLESLKAIRDAGGKTGFILSTGDQCPRDTPEINIYTMVDTVKEYGIYPLNIDKIDSEIERIEKILDK